MRAGGGVGGAEVGLQKSVGREAEAGAGGLQLGGVELVGRGGVGAFRAPEARTPAMHAALVRAPLAGRLEAQRAEPARHFVELRARIRLLQHVHGGDVFLQRGVLAEGGGAGRVQGAAVLVAAVVRGMVAAQPGGRQELLAAACAVADEVADGGVCAFHVVREVRFAQEGLAAADVLAVEGALVCVRAEVFG